MKNKNHTRVTDESDLSGPDSPRKGNKAARLETFPNHHPDWRLHRDITN